MPGLPISTSPPPVDAFGLAVGRSGIGAPPAPDDFGRASRPDSVALVSGLAEHAETTTSASTDATRLAHEGWQRYAKGDVEAARDLLARAARSAPRVAWIQYALGQSEFTLQHMDAAAASFERARAAMPDYEPVYFDLADAYLQLRRQGDALSVLRDAAQRWPSDPETHLAVGCVLVSRNAFEDAAGAFGRATTLAPDNAVAYFNLGRAYHLIYIRLIRSSSANVTGTSMLAERNRQLAIGAYRKCLAIGSPFDADARQALAVLGWKSGQ
jgi:tetratricopeptide (TPR) repeat protein